MLIADEKAILLHAGHKAADEAFVETSGTSDFPLAQKLVGMGEKPACDTGTHRCEQVGRPPRNLEAVGPAFYDDAKAWGDDVGIARKVEPADSHFFADLAADVTHERNDNQRYSTPADTASVVLHLLRGRSDQRGAGGLLEFDDERV